MSLPKPKAVYAGSERQCTAVGGELNNKNGSQSLSFLIGFAPIITYGGGGQLAARGPHVACQSGFGGPQKHSEKSSNFKFEDVKLITVNVSVEDNSNRDLLLFSVD